MNFLGKYINISLVLWDAFLSFLLQQGLKARLHLKILKKLLFGIIIPLKMSVYPNSMMQRIFLLLSLRHTIFLLLSLRHTIFLLLSLKHTILFSSIFYFFILKMSFYSEICDILMIFKKYIFLFLRFWHSNVLKNIFLFWTFWPFNI